MNKIWEYFSSSKNDNYAESKKYQEMDPEERTKLENEQIHKLVGEYKLKEKKAELDPNNVIGLDNLGNTCFMNSVLQCLIHTKVLRKHFLENDWSTNLNVLISPSKGLIACEFYLLLVKYLSTSKDSIAPSSLKKTFQKFKNNFATSQQQDSQEFLSYFLDLLHEDLNLVKKKPYKSIDYTKDQDISEYLNKSYAIHMERNNSFIVDNFHGQFYSKIICPEPECRRESLTGDPFEILSLNIPHRGDTKYETYLFPASYETIIEKYVFNCMVSFDTNVITKHIKDHSPSFKNKRVRLFYYERLRIINEIFEDHPSMPSTITNSKGYAIYCETVSAEISTLLFEERATKLFATDWNNAFKLKMQVVLNGDFNGIERMLEVPEDITRYEIELLSYMVHRKVFLEASFFHEKGREYPKTRQEVEKEYKSFQEFCQNQKCNKFMLVEVSSGETVIPENVKDLFSLAHNKILRVNVMFSPLKTTNLKLRTIDANKDVPDLLCPIKSIDLHELLEISSRKEILDAENTWYCPTCKVHKQASKELLLYKMPNILIIHLKRFKLIEHGSHHVWTKNKDLINIPFELDMTKYVYQPKDECTYSLYAVSNHYGGLGGGHYVATCKAKDDQWYLFDDESKKKISQNNVISESAYVLFFEKKQNKKSAAAKKV